MCVTNYTYQEVAFKGQIVESANIILCSSTTVSLEVCLNNCTVVHIHYIVLFNHQVLYLAWETDKVCVSTIELLDVMLEETHENNKVLVEGTSQDLSVESVDTVLTTMKDLYVCREYYILYYM